MNKTSPFLILALTLLLGTAKSEAQLYFWDTAVTNGQWNDIANWTDGVVPNEAGAVVYFDNINPAVGLSGFTATSGEINVANSAVFGSTTNSDDILNLDTGSTNQPLISVATGSAFMYAELTGTNGFRKAGGGRLSFRFNNNDQNYTGAITLAGGTLGINQDGSLGAAGNGVVVESSSTLQSEPGNNTNPVSLGDGRSISIASGATLTVNNSAAAVATTINGPVSGDGGFAFGGTGTLTLSGTNSYKGTTTVNGPGFGGSITTNFTTNTTNSTISTNIVTNGATRTSLFAFGGPDSAPATNPLVVTMGTASAIFSTSTVTVNLGGAAVTPSSFSAVANGATANPPNSTNSLLSINITNGSLTYSAPSQSFLFNTKGAGAVTAELRLPQSTTLTYDFFGIGTTNGASQNAMLTSRVLISSNAILNANLFSLATYRSSGSIEAAAPGGALKLRAADGTSPVPQILIGNFSGGANPTASINLSNGSVDIAATEIIVGRNIANNSGATGTLLFSNGTVSANSLVVGNAANVGNVNISLTNTNVVTGTVTQNAGTATVSNVVLGRSAARGSTNGVVVDKYVCTYNLNGGTLATTLISSDSTNAAISGMTRTFNLNGGTLRSYDASSDLTITAATNAFAAIALATGTTNSKSITVDAGRNINLGSGVWMQINGGVTTLGLAAGSALNAPGRFTLGLAGTTPATLLVTNGTVNFASTVGIFGIGDRTAGSSTLEISGGTVNIGLTNNRMLVGNKGPGFVNVAGGTLNVTGNADLYIGGDIQYGLSNASGTVTVGSAGLIDVQGAGLFVLGQNQTNNGTTGCAGTLNIGSGGTLRTSRPISTGTNGTGSSGTVNFNGGTLAAGTNVANLIAVTTATVASNTTIDTGTFDSGIGQNLLGSGILTVSGNGTLRLNGSNSTPVVVNSGATLGGTGTAGSMVVNGTIAPGLAATNGTLTSTASVTVPGAARFRLFANGSNDRLVSLGTVDLSGGSVTVTNNYPPANGDTYDLIDGTISGSPTLNLPTLDGGLVWVTNDFASSGVLSVTNGSTPTNNYDSWVAFWQTNSGGTFTNTGGASDPDGDGFVNNLEFAFDGNPTVGTPALMTVTPAGTNAVFNWVERIAGASYEVQKNTTLTNAWGPAVVTISNSANTNGILIPADYLRKEFVVPASGKDFYRVQATITNN